MGPASASQRLGEILVNNFFSSKLLVGVQCPNALRYRLHEGWCNHLKPVTCMHVDPGHHFIFVAPCPDVLMKILSQTWSSVVWEPKNLITNLFYKESYFRLGCWLSGQQNIKNIINIINLITGLVVGCLGSKGSLLRRLMVPNYGDGELLIKLLINL